VGVTEKGCLPAAVALADAAPRSLAHLGPFCTFVREQGSPIHLPTSLRKLAEEPDGYCDATRRAQDPDCGGAVPAAACARTSGMAAAAGYPGYCMQDAGCMSIQVRL